MSISYTFLEKLEITSSANPDIVMDICRAFYDRYAFLGACVLQNRANFFPLRLKYDDCTYEFEGNKINSSFQEIVSTLGNAMADAAKDDRPALELSAQYMFELTTWDYFEGDNQPFTLCDYLGNLSQEELSGIFYSMHNQADCDSDSAGILTAYGEKNGIFYHGVIDYEPIDHIPSEGYWVSADAVAEVDIELADVQNKDEIISACRALIDFQKDDSCYYYELNGTFLTFQLFQTTIESEMRFKEFLDLSTKLMLQTKGVACIGAELFDLNDPYGHLLRVEFAPDGTYSVAEAKIK